MASNPVDMAEAAAEEARTRVSTTIDDIQTRLDPRRVVGDAVSKVQNSSRALASQAGVAAKTHPLAIGAAVVALGLALLARNRLSGATVNLGDGTADYTDYTDYDDGYADDGELRVSRPRAFVGDARNGVAASPGVSIVLGLMAGAALGALLPVSDVERRTFGETSGRLGAAARAAVRRASEEMDDAGLKLETVKTKARAAARSVADAARAELKP